MPTPPRATTRPAARRGAWRAGPTSGDGLHLHYPGTDQRNGSLRGQHLDFRGRGGYVLLPPSVGQTKAHSLRYEVVATSDRPARPLDWAAVVRLVIPAPGPVADHPRVRPAAGDARDPMPWLVAHVARQTEGSRNNSLYWAACRAVEAGAPDLEPLVAAALRAGLPEHEARRTVRSATALPARRPSRPSLLPMPGTPTR